MGASARAFLEMRDMEVNSEGGEYFPPIPHMNQEDYSTYYRTRKGDIIKEVGGNGRIKYCVYPNSDRSYSFWKGDIERIWEEDERIKAAALWK